MEHTSTGRSLVAIILSLTLVATACTTSIGGTATPAANSRPSLDTGNFATTARTIEAKTPADAWQQEGFRIGDSVVEPWSIDARYTTGPMDDGLLLNGPVVSTTQLTDPDFRFLSKDQTSSLSSTHFRAGFIASSSDPNKTAGKLRVGLLRFKDSTNVGDALRIMTSPTGGTTIPVPNSTVLRTENRSGRRSIYAAIQKDNLMIFAAVTDAADTVDIDTILTRALNAQLEKSTSYQQTPDSDGIPAVPMDVYGLMSRTLQSNASGAKAIQILGLSQEFRPGDGYRSIYVDNLMLPDPSYYQMTKGSEVTMKAETAYSVVVYAGSPEDALRYRTMIGGNSPSCLPNVGDEYVSCSTDADGTSSCAMNWGRRAAFASNNIAIVAKQRCAAQYMILKTAG
jgi:hypothetical protein